jgi:endonuclease/exonuclease/phosphatase family metal-dependent hydrolase
MGPISFVGTHLCHQSEELRTLQTRRMSQLFPSDKGIPTILAGDFNARPGSVPMNVLTGNGWTDAVSPRSVIDYVLVRQCDPWTIQDVTIVEEPGDSDHDPVLVVLQWQDKQ